MYSAFHCFSMFEFFFSVGFLNLPYSNSALISTTVPLRGEDGSR